MMPAAKKNKKKKLEERPVLCRKDSTAWGAWGQSRQSEHCFLPILSASKSLAGLGLPPDSAFSPPGPSSACLQPPALSSSDLESALLLLACHLGLQRLCRASQTGREWNQSCLLGWPCSPSHHPLYPSLKRDVQPRIGAHGQVQGQWSVPAVCGTYFCVGWGEIEERAESGQTQVPGTYFCPGPTALVANNIQAHGLRGSEATE